VAAAALVVIFQVLFQQPHKLTQLWLEQALMAERQAQQVAKVEAHQ
jgi:hypothetical protein